jgi:hypothetical protein
MVLPTLVIDVLEESLTIVATNKSMFLISSMLSYGGLDCFIDPFKSIEVA